MPMTTLVRVCGLRKSYARRQRVFSRALCLEILDGIELEIRAGTTLALVGESGSGKSTLARCLARLEDIDSGEIWFDGREVSSLRSESLRLLRREIQIVFQDPASALNCRFSVAEIIMEPLVIQGICSRREGRLRALDLMEQVGLPRLASGRLPLELSGGQRQRLAIARALALEPRFLILDEALSGLDLSIQAQLIKLLLDLQASRSLTYLFISHDLGVAAGIADEIAVMNRGRIAEKAPGADLFKEAQQPITRSLLSAIPSIRSI
jgi:ABC-type oligopeptide transport system ATPase subunit